MILIKGFTIVKWNLERKVPVAPSLVPCNPNPLPKVVRVCVVGSSHHKHHLADCCNTTEDRAAEQQGIRKTNVPSALSQEQILGNDVILTYLHSYDTSRPHHLNIIFFSVQRNSRSELDNLRSLGDFSFHCSRGRWFTAGIRWGSRLLRLLLQGSGHSWNFLKQREIKWM